MEEKEIVKISVDYGIGAQRDAQIGVAIVCAPTGVLCNVQARGVACKQPTVEGYAIPLHIHGSSDTKLFFKALEELDDCGWGCHSTLGVREEVRFLNNTDWRYREDYALEIYKFINDNLNDNATGFTHMHFSLDYDRLEELMEGWWPVLIRFKEYFAAKAYYNTEFKGYLHFGNCD